MAVSYSTRKCDSCAGGMDYDRVQKVWICRYVTEGSFDAYSWQLLETKQRFIASLDLLF